MAKKMRKRSRYFLTAAIVVCMGVILIGGFRYIASLRENLEAQSAQNVLTVTKQQQQAFDNFIAGDRERLHSFAEFFARGEHASPGEIQQQLTLFNEVDAIYSVICLDESWFCSNASENIRPLSAENLEFYSSLTGSGVRDNYIGLFSGEPKFGYYETFTFASGHRGLIQKSYERSKVSAEFSLSFYDNQGLAYVVNQKGDILLRSTGALDNQLYNNIFDILSGNEGLQKDIDRFMEAMNAQETGSITFSGSRGRFVYTYVPMENVEDWYLVSIVPEEAITAEADEIIMDSRLTLAALSAILVLCGIFMILIWRTHKDMEEKDREIDYQEKFFDIFATYLANNTDDVYLMVDVEEDQIEYISPNVKRVLGVPAQSITSNLKLFSGAIYASGEQADFNTLHMLEPGMSLEAMTSDWINPETEERKYFQIKVYCTQVQEKRKIIIYISDRTQDRRVQDTLTEALKMAQAANDAKSSFLSSVSHDIRTPMNAIIGFIGLLQDEAENPELVREYTQRIDAASQHLLGLINDVLDMNKIESGSATLNLSEVNLADIIDEINTIIRPQVKAKNQTFEIFTSSITHEHLQADKLRINQILINLLSNAVKYTQEGGDIQMRVDELPQVLDEYSRVRFTISDNGMGMSEEYQRVIFDPFTREDTATSRQIQGTGLGMAITKSLVDLLGGTIQVESKAGEGSTFTVELELPIQEQEDDPQFWPNYNVRRMIVADDDEEVCLNIVKVMSEKGVVTDYATDGETAVHMMRAARKEGEPYDLILLDWKMPNLDGLETARLIRKKYSEKIPILLLTAYDWEEIEQEAVEIGVNHFMPKPFFMSTFKDAIRRVMGGQKKAAPESDSMVVNGKHILVVDDIEVNRIILVKILTTLGATCEVACDGQEALSKFEASPPGKYQLILMDVQMPIIDGYEATRAIRASGHPEAGTVPIIAMTANAFVDDVRDAIESGMDAHIAKPVQLDKLKSTIQTVFDSRKQQKNAAKEERGSEQ